MTTETPQSSRIFVRYAGKSANCFPTEDDVRKMFSVHGLIVGMFCMFFAEGYIIAIMFSMYY